MDFVQEAATLGFEWAVQHPRRPARISRRFEFLAALAAFIVTHDQVAGDEIHFFPVIMHEGSGGERARFDPQQARAASRFPALVDVAREYLLFDADRVAGR